MEEAACLLEILVRCPYCDRSVPDDSLVCPVCGFGLGGTRQPEWGSIRGARADRGSSSPGLLWYIVLLLLATALLSGTIALGLLGAEQGLEIGRERARQLGQQYYDRGLAHLEEGNYLLALAEFEEAVRLAPGNPEAREQLGLLQALMGTEDTYPSAPSTEALLSLYGEASALHAQGSWAETIVRLEEVRSLDPRYHTQEVEDMLFDAYRRQSTELLEAGELEEALTLLDEALELRPDDPDAAELRHWLSLYLAGLSQWGVDWESTAETFRQLYVLNPTFLDVGQRLHDALLKVGDLYYEEGAWCVAESVRTGSAGDALRRCHGQA